MNNRNTHVHSRSGGCCRRYARISISPSLSFARARALVGRSASAAAAEEMFSEYDAVKYSLHLRPIITLSVYIYSSILCFFFLFALASLARSPAATAATVARAQTEKQRRLHRARHLNHWRKYAHFSFSYFNFPVSLVPMLVPSLFLPPALFRRSFSASFIPRFGFFSEILRCWEQHYFLVSRCTAQELLRFGFLQDLFLIFKFESNCSLRLPLPRRCLFRPSPHRSRAQIIEGNEQTLN